MSVRGTITSRADVSPSSKTDWIIRRFFVGHDATFLRHVHEFTQLDFRRERAVAEALTRGQCVTHEDQDATDRPEQNPDPQQWQRRGHRDGVRMLAPKRSRSDADDHVRDENHDHRGDGQRPAQREDVDQAAHEYDGGRDLAQNAKQDHQIHVSRTIGQNALHSRGAGSLFLCHLVDPRRRNGVERRVDGREDTTDRDKSNRQNKERYGATHYRTPG